jgi:hypothetical protein
VELLSFDLGADMLAELLLIQLSGVWAGISFFVRRQRIGTLASEGVLMFRLVERCLRDGDDAAWVELWEVFEEAGDVRRILTKNGVSPEDADAVVAKCWNELTGSGSFFGADSADGADEPWPPKNVPDPLEPREAANSQGDTGAPVANEPSPLKNVPDPLGPRQAVYPLRSFVGKSMRELKEWFADGSGYCILKLVEAGKLLFGEPTKKKAKRIEPRRHHFETLEPRQMLANKKQGQTGNRKQETGTRNGDRSNTVRPESCCVFCNSVATTMRV